MSLNFTARGLTACLFVCLAACGPLEASTESGAVDEGQTSQEVSSGFSGTVRRGEEKRFGPFDATTGAITVSMTGTGDADMLVKLNRTTCEPGLAGTNETCRLKGPGAFSVTVTGIAPSSSFTLSVKYTRSHRDGGVDGGTYDGGDVDGGDVDGGVYDGGVYDGGAYDGGAYDGGAYDGGAYDGGDLDGGDLDGGSYDGGDLDGGSYDGGDLDGGSADAGARCGSAVDCNPNGAACCVAHASMCAFYCQ